jgi:hypothetical protein
MTAEKRMKLKAMGRLFLYTIRQVQLCEQNEELLYISLVDISAL